MNLFDYEGEEFDKKLDEIFKNKNKEELKQELIECGLEINNSNRLKYLMKKIDKIVENMSIEEIEERIKVDEMEEDLKILERLINYLKKKRESPYAIVNENFVELDGVFLELNYVINSLENIIKRYKELEELLEAKTIRVGFENKEDYIPKSKVREKIEELENYIQENSDEQGYWSREHQEEIYAKIEILQELLQEGDTNATKM